MAMCSKLRAFTLIELLVVIGIIALMIGILFPVVGAALNKGNKARAQHEISQLVAAIRAYYGEYGQMPVPAGDNGDADHTYGDKSKTDRQNSVIAILRGVDTTQNRNGRVYLDIEKGAMVGVDMAGASYVETDGYFLDPWGNPYIIAMDTDSDGVVRFSGLSSPPAPGATFSATGRIAAAVSYGPDPSASNSLISSAGLN